MRKKEKIESMRPLPAELPELYAVSSSFPGVWKGVIARLRVYDQEGTGQKVFAYVSPGHNNNYVGWSSDPNVIHALFLARDNGNSLTGYSNDKYKIEVLDY